MSPLTGADVVLAAGVGSAGMTAAMWILGPIAVIAALGMITVRKAVHCALLLAVVMMCLAVFYAVQDAPFLAVVQVIVYTGAVLMLFLFVLMLVGVDSSDSIVETIKGQRVLSWIVAVVFGVMIVVAFAHVVFTHAVGLAGPNEQGNVTGIASLLFTRYVFAFEMTSALLITAVLGAMVLAHRERLEPKKTQRDYVTQRLQDYRDSGTHPGQRILPGTLAQHNSVSTPARLPDGTHVVMAIPGVSPGGDAPPEAVATEEFEIDEVAERADEAVRARRGGEPE